RTKPAHHELARVRTRRGSDGATGGGRSDVAPRGGRTTRRSGRLPAQTGSRGAAAPGTTVGDAGGDAGWEVVGPSTHVAHPAGQPTGGLDLPGPISLIGRNDDVAEVAELLTRPRQPPVRLVSLVGLAGVGKT